MDEVNQKKSPPPPSLSRMPEPTPVVHIPSAPSGPPPEAPPKVKVAVASADEEDEELPGALAPLNSRLLAGFLDFMVAAGLSVAFSTVLPGFLDQLAWLAGGGYIVTRDSLPFLGGQSIGKKALKILAVKEDGKDGTSLKEDWQTGLIRNIALVIPFFPLVEAIVLINRDGKVEKGKRLGDEWAKTKVIVAPVAES